MSSGDTFVTIPGLSQIRANLQRMGDEIAEKTNRTIYRGVERAATKAKDVYCPIETGALRSTIHVEIEKDGVALVAGGPSADYALIVHEDLSAKHFTKPGTGPKYLERPALEEAPKIGDELRKLL
jgi:hypothetical protein